jgi:hypothetical protein
VAHAPTKNLELAARCAAGPARQQRSILNLDPPSPSSSSPSPQPQPFISPVSLAAVSLPSAARRQDSIIRRKKEGRKEGGLSRNPAGSAGEYTPPLSAVRACALEEQPWRREGISESGRGLAFDSLFFSSRAALSPPESGGAVSLSRCVLLPPPSLFVHAESSTRDRAC